MTCVFLSSDWVDRTLALASGQPERAGASVRVQHVVTRGRGKSQEEWRYHWIVEDGRVVRSGMGTLEDAEMSWTATHDEAVEMLKGQLDPAAAFMRGTVKVAGDLGKVMTLLLLLATDTYRRLFSDLVAETVFS